MLKKMLCVLLCVLMLPVALAEESTAPLLSLQELQSWAEGYIARAKTAAPLNDADRSFTPDGYEYIYEFATLYGDTPYMSADTVITAIVLTSDEENGPRNVNVGNSMAVVLNAYYHENPDLRGTQEAAVLYTADMLPESAQWAQVTRDGQRVNTIQYGLHEQHATGGEGYTDTGVIYTMVDNRVSAIRVYGLNSRIDLDVVNQVMYNAMATAMEDDYAQVLFSYDGLSLEKFQAEDLVFSGMDFVNLTPEAAVAVFGEASSDIWTEDGDAGYMRVQTYPDFELIYLYNKERTEGHVYMMAVHGDGVEGPRAVRVGDEFSAVYNRFRNSEGDYLEDGSEMMYGVEGEGSYAKASYGYDASATALYSFLLEDGRRVSMQLFFDVMECSQILLFID